MVFYLVPAPYFGKTKERDRGFFTIMSEEFLASYNGQSIQELIAMKHTHRIDSLVLAAEQALYDKPRSELSEPERVVLAVEAMEREVNNGGYHQFFTNSSHVHTDFIVRALELINCPKVAAITGDAIARLQLPEQYQAENVESVAMELSDEEREKLGECDSRYYENDENIAENLFAYIEQHQHEIRIPHVT
jgi:hypothetical protein